MFYDIYGLSMGRDQSTVERFLRHFCYRDPIAEPLQDQWVQVWPSEKYHIPELIELPMTSIADMIAYAVRHPNHGFVFYNQFALRTNVKSAIVKFTYDGKVVFGISISDAYQVLAIEAEIKHVTQAYKSYIAVEYPPACDEEEFDADVLMWQDSREDYC
ncbi:hypothetical protein [Hymenobacter cellulosilyticus]|uniref:Uncharacterized protein n=1 Tax=Hymenobacter cellulosilyticus TaxID=2932248 RepID=A0A8T9QC78_9BACT|nr:hypothetical protein [Hymenobacter cellulosilyticus]UOQ75117.1 hypothetical protein MUN79_29010 [Hymenobacter cellulosilyticus]